MTTATTPLTVKNYAVHDLSPQRHRMLGWGLGLCLGAALIPVLWGLVEAYVLAPAMSSPAAGVLTFAENLAFPVRISPVFMAWIGYWLLTTPPTPLRRPFKHKMLRWFVRLGAPLAITSKPLLFLIACLCMSREITNEVGQWIAQAVFLTAMVLFFIEPLVYCALLWFLSDLARTIPALQPPAHLWRLRYLTAICFFIAPLLLWLPSLVQMFGAPETPSAATNFFVVSDHTLRNCSLALDYIGTLGLCFLIALLLQRVRTTPYLEQMTQRPPAP